ncbi:MAG TPA: hydrophobic protein [Actinomycetota bacterium]|nr:hydrophobic protein [Actinomycetota bacterium]
MAAILVLAIILALFGGGFALEILWYVAIAALILWVVGFLARGSGARWYRW